MTGKFLGVCDEMTVTTVSLSHILDSVASPLLTPSRQGDYYGNQLFYYYLGYPNLYS